MLWICQTFHGSSKTFWQDNSLKWFIIHQFIFQCHLIFVEYSQHASIAQLLRTCFCDSQPHTACFFKDEKNNMYFNICWEDRRKLVLKQISTHTLEQLNIVSESTKMCSLFLLLHMIYMPIFYLYINIWPCIYIYLEN